MRKIIALILASLAFACGGSDDPEPDQNATPVHAPACQASATCL